MNSMMKMCQVVIRQCEGYTEHKPEVVDYYEPFRDFMPQILKAYTPKICFYLFFSYIIIEKKSVLIYVASNLKSERR